MVLFHGSPYGGLRSFVGVRPPVFLTPRRSVAAEYATREMVGAHRAPSGVARTGPTVYTVDVSGVSIFDMRTDEARELYTDLRKRKLPQLTDPDERASFPPLRAEGFLSSHSGFPLFGYVRPIIELLAPLGQFDALWAEEGSQGPSLALFRHLERAVITDVEEVTTKGMGMAKINKKTAAKPRIRISYEVITEESARNGDVAERGWEDEEGEAISLDDGVDEAIAFLEDAGAVHPSSSAFHPGVWYSTEGEQDYNTGETTIYSYHLVDFDNDAQEEIYEAITDGG